MTADFASGTLLQNGKEPMLPAGTRALTVLSTQKGNADGGEKEDGFVGTVLSWASLSYAFGFFIVMVHTARLGLPVLDLIEPIYVWVGLPIAVVTFLWRWIIALFQAQALALAEDLRAAISPQVSAKPGDADYIPQLLAILASMPVFGTAIRLSLKPFPREQLVETARLLRERVPEVFDKQVRWIYFFVRVARGYSAMGRSLTLLSYAMIIGGALFAYMWLAYPAIPLSLGGGRPAPVRLIVESNAVPSAAPSASTPPESTTIDAKLLYMTKDHYFIEEPSGRRVSIKADAVLAVIWN